MVFPHNQFPQIHLSAPSDPIRRQLLYNALPMICNIAEKAEIAYTTMVIEKWRLYNETICPCASIDPLRNGQRFSDKTIPNQHLQLIKDAIHNIMNRMAICIFEFFFFFFCQEHDGLIETNGMAWMQATNPE